MSVYVRVTSFPLRVVQGQKNAEKARTQSKNADQTYLETVKNLEEARALWEREMELLCRVREQPRHLVIYHI